MIGPTRRWKTRHRRTERAPGPVRDTTTYIHVNDVASDGVLRPGRWLKFQWTSKITDDPVWTPSSEHDREMTAERRLLIRSREKSVVVAVEAEARSFLRPTDRSNLDFVVKRRQNT